jgi:hypothetical protein
VSEPALALAFFDPDRGVHGIARSAFTVLMQQGEAATVPDGPSLERSGDDVAATLPGRFELTFAPVSPSLELGLARSRVCRVRGKVGRSKIDCLGALTETERAPAWAELDALRAIAAIFDPETAVMAVARRPRGALGHGDELVTACLLSKGEVRAVEEARISTVYDAGGRQRTAGVELWLPAEDFPRRAFGTALAGTTLELEGLRVDVAIFGWRMEGGEGAGSYEISARSREPAAA